MVAIVGGTGSGHIYVEHAPGEVTREGVEHQTTTRSGVDLEEEDEVIEVDCLSDDDDDEVLVARSKRKMFIANQGTYPIEGFNIDVDAIFDGDQQESSNKKNVVGVDIENEFSSDEGSFFTGSREDETGDVRPMRRKKITDHFDPNSSSPHICIGMVFDSRDQFKDAINKYSVSNRRELKMTLNDKRRVQYKCKSEGCSFAIFASIDRMTNEFIVHTFKDSHGQYCRPSFSSCRVTYKVLGKHFLSRLRIMPKMLAIDIKRLVKEELLVDVTYSQCRRAKEWALSWISGLFEMEVSKLWDYAWALRIASKGENNMVNILAERLSPAHPLYFKRLFVCLDACRLGFLEECRLILGLDGCFLKGDLKGELLSAVARDANDQMYTVAWAYVEGEDMESWAWFLAELDPLVGLSSSTGFTIISDTQKGLEIAISRTYPRVEHRLSARHFFANWRKKHKGSELQRLFWSACKSTTIGELDQCMSQIRSLKAVAADDMLRRNAKCRARILAHILLKVPNHI